MISGIAIGFAWEQLRINRVLTPFADSAMYLAFYNFVRPHMTLKTTPAVTAGLTDHKWTM